MARELSAILSELNNVYDPQRQVVKQQQDAIDPMIQAEQQGLSAAKTDAFSQITDQANRRGMFYSGMPVAEEQKYTGSTYLPALANLQGKYNQQRFNLQDTLNKIQSDQYNQASGIHQGEVTADEERRRWQAQFDAQQAANAKAASSASSGYASPSYSTGVLGATTKATPKVNPADQLLFNQMFVQGNGQAWNDQALVNDYNATLKSAQYGNARDIQKINMYHSARPDLFGSQIPNLKPATKTAGVSNGGGGGW